ncbi:MAG: phosphoribosylanthranilate isomerase [Chloroflexota bacterium]
MKIQIYTMQTVEEALELARLGVEHLGLTPGEYGLPGEISFAAAAEIAAALRGRATSVALTVDDNLERIAAMVAAVRPDILHLCGLAGSQSPEQVAELRRRLPGLPLMQAISVGGPTALQEALAYHELVDYLILDTQAPDIAGIGASGRTHDWNVSRAIVQQARCPVVLAGGLSPENVAEAVRAVRPWAVDSLTHTNRRLPGGGFRKDPDRVEAFAQAAREAARDVAP